MSKTLTVKLKGKTVKIKKDGRIIKEIPIATEAEFKEAMKNVPKLHDGNSIKITEKENLWKYLHKSDGVNLKIHPIVYEKETPGPPDNITNEELKKMKKLELEKEKYTYPEFKKEWQEWLDTFETVRDSDNYTHDKLKSLQEYFYSTMEKLWGSLDIDTIIYREDLKQKIFDFTKEMSEKDKSIFYDFFIEGKNQNRIAIERKIPTSTLTDIIKTLYKKVNKFVTVKIIIPPTKR